MGSERDVSYPGGDRQPGAYPAYPGSAESRPPRPPLTKRMRPVHWIAIDCVVGGFLALCGAATVVAATAGGDLAGGDLAGPGRLPLVLLVMAVVFVPVALRRRAPVVAFGALVILGVLLARLSPSVSALIFLAAAFVLYTVTVQGRRRTGAAALGLMLAVMVTLTVTGVHSPRADASGVFVPVALANVIAWMTGYSVRQRRLYVVTLQHQAASSAVAEERLRIARELHDVVAHSMSVIAVQAGYGQYVMDASPDGARNALGAIQATSRDALEEMRRMLGVLRQQDVTPSPVRINPVPGQAPPSGDAQPRQAPLAPAPGLAGLDRLIERTRGAGVRVTLEVSGRPRPAPAGVDLSAYRIIQEALTNVVRHAGTGASCVVGVCYTDAELVIRVTDDGGLPVVLPSVSVAATGTGHGIIGMRERVHLCGGTFGAGSLPNGGFQVTAALPLPAADFRAEGGFRADGAMAAAVDSLSNGSRPDGSRPDGSLAAAGSITLAVAGSITPRTGNGTPAMTGVVTGDGDGRR